MHGRVERLADLAEPLEAELGGERLQTLADGREGPGQVTVAAGPLDVVEQYGA